MRPFVAGLIALSGMLWSSSTATAWTRTSVESVRAHLDVREHGSALVLLEVDLRVHGGWLSHFELHGLGDGVTLDADKPPWLVGDDGRKYVPAARARDDGRVEISFPRRSRAPWRGRYTLGVLYHVTLPRAPGSSTAHWTMPAWHVDLQNVVVNVQGPAGLQVLDAGADNTEVAARSHGPRVHLELKRAQLPRTLRWELALAMPDAAAATAAIAEPGATDRRRPFSGAPLLACTLLALLAWLKRGTARADAQRQGALALALLPLGRAELAAAVILACGVGAGWLQPTHPQAALALLILTSAMGLTRGAAALPASPSPLRRRAVLIDVQRARHERLHMLLGMRAWLDATTPLGATLLLASGSLVLVASRAHADPVWLECWLAASPLFFNATRLSLPRSDTQTLLQLGRLKASLREALGADAARLSIHVERCGARPTLEIQPAAPVAGLRGLRLGRAPAGAASAAPGSELCWLVICDPGSPADAQLERALPDARTQRSQDGRRSVRSLRSRVADTELRVLLDALAEQAASAGSPRHVRSAA